jgi:Holliday junction DNA helicase RuvA
MIHAFHGRIVGKEDSKIIVQVSNISFELLVTNPLFFEVDKEYSLPAFLHWHPEQGPTLYGFISPLEKSLFILLISCSGIGPKSALQLLHQQAPEQFLAILASGDYKTLSSLQGIGPKKAEMLILTLKEKAQKLYEAGLFNKLEQPQSLNTIKKLQDTLTALHYSRPEIKHVLDHLQQEQEFTTASFDILMRKALHMLAKKI